MKRIIDVDENLICEGFVRNFTKEEKDVLINAIRNSIPYEPEGNLADEVWKLYEKYQPHLATRVIEFGDELKELLGKYQEGGKEE